jgi:serine/threonine protein kinase
MERARANLSQTLYELKQELGEDWLVRQGNMLHAREPLWVDALAFEGRLKEGRHSEAADLYRGPFLDGAFLAQTHPFEEWVEHRRGYFRRLHREALEGYILRCREAGDLERAVTSASNWVAMDPLCEAAQHQFIRLLADSGSRDEAVAQYERYAASLHEELGLEPLAETKELIAGIRSPAFKPVLRTPREVEPRPTTWPPPTPNAFDGEAVDVRIRDRMEFRKMVERELAPQLQVLRPIGRGSMADVFLARDPALRCLVAVKFLSPELYRDEEARGRFRREAQAMAKLEQHPNVCDVKWVSNLEDRTPYLVMPFIKGTTLAQRLKAEGRLSPAEVRVVLLEVASALAAAHREGVIHRDVRPDNILREEETGRNILSDFGIAGVLETGEEGGPKLTRTGELLGHPAYISPEQMKGEPLTEKSDIFSLGMMGHELLTGHPPLPLEEGDLAGAGGRAVSTFREYGEKWNPVDRRLVDLIIRCLAKNPAHRPSAADIEQRLKEDERESRRSHGQQPEPLSPWRLLWERRLPQILGGYAAGAWLAAEATSELEGRDLLPEPAFLLVLVSVPFGFLAVTILGWFHGRKGRQKMWPLGAEGGNGFGEGFSVPNGVRREEPRPSGPVEDSSGAS